MNTFWNGFTFVKLNAKWNKCSAYLKNHTTEAFKQLKNLSLKERNLARVNPGGPGNPGVGPYQQLLKSRHST